MTQQEAYDEFIALTTSGGALTDKKLDRLQWLIKEFDIRIGGPDEVRPPEEPKVHGTSANDVRIVAIRALADMAIANYNKTSSYTTGDKTRDIIVEILEKAD